MARKKIEVAAVDQKPERRKRGPRKMPLTLLREQLERLEAEIQNLTALRDDAQNRLGIIGPQVERIRGAIDLLGTGEEA